MQTRAKLLEDEEGQVVLLPEEFRFEGEEVLISRQGHKVILEPVRRTWCPEFLEMIGTACDFPYPDEPPPLGPGPDFDFDSEGSKG